MRIFEKSVFFEIFRFLHFWLDEVCLGVDLARCGCAMNMVDGLVERLDLALSEHGMVGFTRVGLRGAREGFLAEIFAFRPSPDQAVLIHSH